MIFHSAPLVVCVKARLAPRFNIAFSKP